MEDGKGKNDEESEESDECGVEYGGEEWGDECEGEYQSMGGVDPTGFGVWGGGVGNGKGQDVGGSRESAKRNGKEGVEVEQ